jgi:hypothetical protein
MKDDTTRKPYEAPRVTARYAWSELMKQIGPAHAIYQIPENP